MVDTTCRMNQTSQPKKPSQLPGCCAASVVASLTSEGTEKAVEPRAFVTLSETTPASWLALDKSDAMTEKWAAAHGSVASWKGENPRGSGRERDQIQESLREEKSEERF